MSVFPIFYAADCCIRWPPSLLRGGDGLRERDTVMDRAGVIHYSGEPGEVPSVGFPVTLRRPPCSIPILRRAGLTRDIYA